MGDPLRRWRAGGRTLAWWRGGRGSSAARSPARAHVGMWSDDERWAGLKIFPILLPK